MKKPVAQLRRLTPLRENIRLLGDILGETIAAAEGRDFFDKVEHIRQLSKTARERGRGHNAARDRLAKLLQASSEAEQYKIAKAFTEFLQLVNVAEQAHRMRRRRDYRARGKMPQKSSPDDLFSRLLKRGVAPAAIKRALRDMNIELIITAHPTEVMMPGAIRAYRDLADSLLALDNTALAPEERDELTDDIRAIILRQWRSRAVRRNRPTPQDEARYGIELTEKILWDAVPMFFRQLRAAYRRKIGSMADLFPNPIRFGSWMGGDRDGHPGVTAKVTREVLDMSRAAAQRLYTQELDTLAAKLSFKTEEARDAALQDRLQWHIAELRGSVAAPRVVFMKKLEALKTLLQAHDLLPIVERELQNLIWRVRVFGMGLLKLDIRQASDVHMRAVDTLLPGYAALDEDAKIARLSKALKARNRPLPKKMPKETREVLDTIAVLRDYPPGLFGNYIISMAGDASDLLAVQFLMRAAGVTARIPICPLFETPDTLERAATVMQRLYAIPAYRRYAGGHQEIMVGYSDSGKRGGYMRSLWDIYTLQEQLTRIGRKRGIETAFFHGRGGAIARGGGPIESVLQMMPRPQQSRRIRITEQGEIINTKFGLPGIAGRTMERYLSGMMDAIFAAKKPVPRKWRAVMEKLAATSAAAFRAAVYEDPQFMAHFNALTPAREMALLKIGSRPGSRKKGGGLENMRAIPWIFSWTQPRVMLPAWLGVAEALEKVRREEGDGVLHAMYRGWPFFTAIIDMIEMSTALADPDVASYYSDMLVPPALQGKTDAYLRALAATRRLVLGIKGEGQLLARNPVLRNAVDTRTPYVDVLNTLQAQVLKAYRNGDKRHTAAKNTLAVTFGGIAAGMHNTG